MSESHKEKLFTRYQIFIIAVLAFIQFTVILDFIIIAPLGAMLMNIMNVTPAQFGSIVSAYAFSAGISGFLAAGFADKFDRKKFLLFFYAGFIVGTFLCGIATNFFFLLVARIITGIFGGVIASVSLAIVTDLFELNVRSRVMGFVQMSFAVAQVAGIPLGIYLANVLGWHAPFFLIVSIGIPAGIIMMKLLRPIDMHLSVERPADHNAFNHLRKTISQPIYIKAFATTALLSLGGFLMMPFSSAFLVNNILIPQENLPLVFMFTGMATIVILPIVGRISDTFGKFRVFTIGTIVASIMIVYYTNLSVTPLWQVVLINVVLFAGIMSRMIPATTMMTAIPELADRGAFMSISSSLQQISGGIASVFAGTIIIQTSTGALKNYDILGYTCVALMFVGVGMMYSINKFVEGKNKTSVS
ncbi:MAG: MFS transporter [Bacteroidota bacterium]|nr:MFS transporter [Bacteroidota bacterium]